MKKGRRTCEILKDVRKRVARENDIPLTERDCTFEGECRGTCPFCEAEVRYLEQELQRRISLGKVVTVAGIAVSSMVMNGCQNQNQTQGEYTAPPATEKVPAPQETEESDDVPKPGQSDTYKVDGVDEIPVIPKNQTPKCSSKLANDTIEDYWELGEVIETEGIIIIEDEPQNDASPLYFTEEMPEFPGGPEALDAFLQREIVYPQVAKDNGVTGTVLVVFVVEKDGSISQAKVKVPLFPDCDKEAVRAVMSMPKWKPARDMGKPVRCYYTIPVSFSL